MGKLTSLFFSLPIFPDFTSQTKTISNAVPPKIKLTDPRLLATILSTSSLCLLFLLVIIPFLSFSPLLKLIALPLFMAYESITIYILLFIIPAAKYHKLPVFPYLFCTLTPSYNIILLTLFQTLTVFMLIIPVYTLLYPSASFLTLISGSLLLLILTLISSLILSFIPQFLKSFSIILQAYSLANRQLREAIQKYLELAFEKDEQTQISKKTRFSASVHYFYDSLFFNFYQAATRPKAEVAKNLNLRIIVYLSIFGFLLLFYLFFTLPYTGSEILAVILAVIPPSLILLPNISRLIFKSSQQTADWITQFQKQKLNNLNLLEENLNYKRLKYIIAAFLLIFIYIFFNLDPTALLDFLHKLLAISLLVWLPALLVNFSIFRLKYFQEDQ